MTYQEKQQAIKQLDSIISFQKKQVKKLAHDKTKRMQCHQSIELAQELRRGLIE